MADQTPVTLEAIAGLFEEKFKAHLDPINKQLSEISGSLNLAHSEIDKLKEKVKGVNEIDRRVENQNAEIAMLRSENKRLKDKMNDTDFHSRSNNLQFVGLPEKRNENPEQRVTDILSRSGIDLDKMDIVQAFRIGQYKPNRTRPVLVKFHHGKTRNRVWDTKHDLKDQSDVTVMEDWPADMLAARKKLLPVLHAAKKEVDGSGEPQNKVRLVKDKLILNGHVYTVDNLNALPKHLHPASIFTPTRGNMVAFFTANSPLSNHYISPFELDGNHYNSNEQFLMYQKAVRFSDMETAQKILQEPNPGKQKELGKGVAGFNRQVWENAVTRILLRGLRAKFHNNPNCAACLKWTADKKLYEASATDTYYGVGVGLFSDDIWDTSKHRGRNLMGECLETVRAELP